MRYNQVSFCFSKSLTMVKASEHLRFALWKVSYTRLTSLSSESRGTLSLPHSTCENVGLTFPFSQQEKPKTT